MRWLVIPLAILLTAASEPAPSGWSPRGVFVFGELVLDFQHQAERGAGPNNAKLVDCSTAQAFCARALVFNLALPRDCRAWRAGDSFAEGGVNTRVLAVDEAYDQASWRLHLAPPQFKANRIYLLGNRDDPFVVFVYSHLGGVQEIFYDNAHRIDLAAMARVGGGLPALREAVKARPNLYYPLKTLDRAGPCLTADKQQAIVRGELRYE